MRHLVPLLLLCLPAASWAQLQPGRHRLIPAVGTTIATQDLLTSTVVMGYGEQPLSAEENAAGDSVSTTISLDPGFYLGLRYSYEMTRRLAVEVEGSVGVSVFVIQMLDLAQQTGEPQYETTTTDARMWRYGVNLAYHMGNWRWFHLFLQGGVGGQIMDLRQKGSIDTDPIRDRTLMFGGGLFFHANDRLSLRAEVRDFVYKFSFDNQFTNPDESWKIVHRRDVGLAVAEAEPTMQHDIAITLGFHVRVH